MSFNPIKIFCRKDHKTHIGQFVLTLRSHDIKTFLDIGANAGQTGLALRKHGYEGKIISFEPLPVAHKHLQKTARKYKNWVVAQRTAIGRSAGTIKLNQSVGTEMSSILHANDILIKAIPRTSIEKTIEAPMITLENAIQHFCAHDDNIFVKIDTQGYEYEVLMGINRAWSQITGFHIEMSLFSLYEGEKTFDEIISFMKEHGFEPYLLYETTFSRVLNRQLQMDGAFYRH